jgi:rubrerythrin
MAIPTTGLLRGLHLKICLMIGFVPFVGHRRMTLRKNDHADEEGVGWMIFNFNAGEVFDIGIKIEENGKLFYDRGRAIIKDPVVQKLFEELAQEETKHKEKFEALKSQLPPSATASTVYDPNNELNLYLKMMADQHVFISSASTQAQIDQIKDAKDALRMAIAFEKDSVIFFLSMQEATEGTKGKEFIGTLVKEELEHLRRLSLELRKIGGK